MTSISDLEIQAIVFRIIRSNTSKSPKAIVKKIYAATEEFEKEKVQKALKDISGKL